MIDLELYQVGHVDSGKSTLSGQLLHLLGRVSKKEMHKFEKEAKEKVWSLSSRYFKVYMSQYFFEKIIGTPVVEIYVDGL